MEFDMILPDIHEIIDEAAGYDYGNFAGLNYQQIDEVSTNFALAFHNLGGLAQRIEQAKIKAFRNESAE